MKQKFIITINRIKQKKNCFEQSKLICSTDKEQKQQATTTTFNSQLIA